MPSCSGAFVFLAVLTAACAALLRVTSNDLMKCSYGERGSLTATCVNATPSYFKTTGYRFDHLDETLRCLNCTLTTLDAGTFDISGNQLKNLDLSHSEISNIRQRAFIGLIFLERLILTGNDIKSVYPGTFTGVKKINYVDLSNNSISILSEYGFLELVNLRQLDLRHNQIGVISTRAFNGLGNLHILDLANNEIADVKDIFNNLTSLQYLNLANNKISNFKGDDFLNLTSLLHLTLSHNAIKSIPAMEFIAMPYLRQLDLSFNAIDKIIPGSFQGLAELENLDVSNNAIAEVPQRTLQNLHNLRNLNVSFNRLGAFQTGLYSGLPQLRALNLSYNAIEAVAITGVFALQSLHTLDLSNNNVTDIDYEAFIWRLPRISYLNLQDNLLPCSLEKEMEEYFAEDNFKFILYGNQVGSAKCVDSPAVRRAAGGRREHGGRDGAAPAADSHVLIYTLIVVTMVMVGALFYLQVRTIRALNAPVFARTRSTSEVQLINSDLEARDNDYLKE